MQAAATLNELIVRNLKLSREAKALLETEESGRKLAELQGNVAGYRKFMDFLAAEFHLTQTFIEDTGDEEMNLADLSDATLDVLSHEIHMLQNESEAWKNVLERITEEDEKLKGWLLYEATKSRELDVAQGIHQAMVMYDQFFESVFSEVNRRNKKKEDESNKARDEGLSLPFSEAS